MTWAIRRCALAAGAAALLTAQAAYAAPTPQPTSSVDPLVSLSVLGTSKSRAAVCTGVSSCAIPAAVPASAAAASAAMGPEDGPGIGPLGLILGVVLIIAIMVAITSGGNDGEGNLTPISPQ